MMYKVAQLMSRVLLLLVVVAMVAARPQHFGESNPDVAGREEEDTGMVTRELLRMMLLRRMMVEGAEGGEEWDDVDKPMKRGANNRLKCYFNPNSDQDASANVLGSGLTDAQLELFAQKLAEMSNQVPSGWEPRWDRRAPEVKRSRFRQCYFNPVSCFKK